MKKILIVGLGLIGGSIAKGLRKKGYEIYGLDNDVDTIKYAKKNNIIIDGFTEENIEYIENFDRIIFSLYPTVFVEYIEKYNKIIKKGSIITDVSGVKTKIVKKIQNLLKDNAEFIPMHPMAGKEVYGIKNADEKIFENANCIITPTKNNTKQGIEFVKKIAKELKFRKVSILSVEKHDEMIAFLSQLTHCIAVALMVCKKSDKLVDYTGDSFRDLTRIANINENMWTELFLMNKKYLIKEMNEFLEAFEELKIAIIEENIKEIKRLMRLSTKRRKMFDKK